MSTRLSVTDCTLLIIGSMVGTGIFLTTGSVASALPSAPLVLLAWFLGGVLALAGALTFAELGAMFPRAGGHYVYMKEAYGPLWGFLDGWVSFLVAFPCAIAFMAMGFAAYLSHFVPAFCASHVIVQAELPWGAFVIHGGHVPALSAVAVLTGLNCLALRVGSGTQNVLSLLKIGCLVLLPILALAGGKWDWASLATHQPVGFSKAVPALGSALLGVSFAYLGWDAATCMAEEVDRPARTLPRSLAVGTGIVVALYLIFNMCLLCLVPLDRMAGAPNVTQRAAARLFGAAGSGVVSALIMISILGTMHATIMVGPRIYFAMARDGLFFPVLGRL